MTQTCKVSKTDIMRVEVRKDYGTTYLQVNVRDEREITDTWMYATVQHHRLNGHAELPRIADDGRPLHGG
jgi:hypothetical protein